METDDTNTNNLDILLPPNQRNLTVKIVGLALFYFDYKRKEDDQDIGDKQWRLFFPEAADHTFKIVIYKTVGGVRATEPVEFILPNASVVNFLPNSKGEPSQDKTDAANVISFGKLHNGTNEQITFSDDTRNYAGFLKMNGTTLVSEETDGQMSFEVWDVKGDSKTKVEVKNIGNTLSAGFKVDTDDATRISVKNDVSFDFVLPYAEINGQPVSYEITFFNDCGEIESCRHLGDLSYYYYIISSSDNNRKFEFVMPPVADRTQNGGCSPGDARCVTLPDGRVRCFTIPASIQDYLNQ
jgi:hypothetical protein